MTARRLSRCPSDTLPDGNTVPRTIGRGGRESYPLFEARTQVRALAFSGSRLICIAYLDEFGHVGPYVSRTHPRHNDSPVFGFAGFVMPAEEVRGFGTR